ncbi:MAG: HPr kinase/phosphorylase [Solirubrobacterales bacterium]
MPAATAFGLDIASDTPLPFLDGAASNGGGRPLAISYGSEPPPWPTDARLISDERHRDGSVSFQIEAAEAGYRIHGPAYGTSVLAGDGTSVRGVCGDEGFDGWQRLLVAQVLPFAAVLQGLEVLHAGAVVFDGGAVAISGPSGAGKTSLALALVRRGAELLADDVVAVEGAGEELLAHPGAPIAGIDRAEVARLRAAGAGEAGSLLAENEREQIARAEVAERPVPLQALFLLERRSEAQGAPQFEPADDPRQLLGSTFNLLLASPERLAGLLDVCAQLARRRVERVRFGPDSDPDELAAALWARLAQ